MKANAKLGTGDLFVVEADESDASFLHLNPVSTILTNIDKEHLETYQGDFERLKATYLDFIHQVPFYSNVFLCVDDDEVRKLIPLILRPIVTYGTSKKAQIKASKLIHKEEKMSFLVEDNVYTKSKFNINIKESENSLRLLKTRNDQYSNVNLSAEKDALDLAKEVEEKNKATKNKTMQFQPFGGPKVF